METTAPTVLAPSSCGTGTPAAENDQGPSPPRTCGGRGWAFGLSRRLAAEVLYGEELALRGDGHADAHGLRARVEQVLAVARGVHPELNQAGVAVVVPGLEDVLATSRQAGGVVGPVVRTMAGNAIAAQGVGPVLRQVGEAGVDAQRGQAVGHALSIGLVDEALDAGCCRGRVRDGAGGGRDVLGDVLRQAEGGGIERAEGAGGVSRGGDGAGEEGCGSRDRGDELLSGGTKLKAEH